MQLEVETSVSEPLVQLFYALCGGRDQEEAQNFLMLTGSPIPHIPSDTAIGGCFAEVWPTFNINSWTEERFVLLGHLLDRGNGFSRRDALEKYLHNMLGASIRNKGVLEQLLEAGVDPNYTTSEGEPFVNSLARHSTPDCIKLFRDHGATFDRQGKESLMTPLMCAIDGGKVDNLATLLECDVKIGVRGPGKRYALHYAAASGSSVMLENVLSKLNGAISPLNVKDAAGNTPLYESVLNGRSCNARMLVDSGADTDIANRCGYTPLAWAELCGYADITALLKELKVA